jgi:hypothetical protein
VRKSMLLFVLCCTAFVQCIAQQSAPERMRAVRPQPSPTDPLRPVMSFEDRGINASTGRWVVVATAYQQYFPSGYSQVWVNGSRFRNSSPVIPSDANCEAVAGVVSEDNFAAKTEIAIGLAHTGHYRFVLKIPKPLTRGGPDLFYESDPFEFDVQPTATFVGATLLSSGEVSVLIDGNYLEHEPAASVQGYIENTYLGTLTRVAASSADGVHRARYDLRLPPSMYQRLSDATISGCVGCRTVLKGANAPPAIANVQYLPLSER